MHSFTISVFDYQNNTTERNFIVEAGKPIIFVGANGSGKTRLALKIERLLELTAHRIPGHRALNLNPQVNRIGEDAAKNRLFGVMKIE